TLTAGIAHDFNNILAGITGNIFLAKHKIADIPDLRVGKLQSRLTVIEELCSRAADMIKKMLAFGRNDMINMTPLNINRLLENMQSMMVRLLPTDIAFNSNICEQQLSIVGDSNQLQQVIMNLLNNASDAVAARNQGATIDLTLQPFTPDAEFLTSHPDAEGVRFAHITIEDNGYGADEETLQHLIEPFFTTKEVGKGTGLGLSMVDGAVAQHHGILTLTSTQGEGMSVDIYLPLTNADDISDENSDAANSIVISGSGETILIADDNQSVRETIHESLLLMGYRVLVAENGREALTLFQQQRQQIGLVLLDIVMPDMGGADSYRQMQRIFNDLPVIFISGYERTRVPSELLAKPHQTLMHKPLNIPHLSSIIHTMLA
ncbi:MAG: response regulator, partial [Mariprofundales bacterium]|nr:response regulator [Mariprofundales bacterium]